MIEDENIRPKNNATSIATMHNWQVQINVQKGVLKLPHIFFKI